MQHPAKPTPPFDARPAAPARRAGCRIVFAGTGGQGVLTAARLLCDAFVARGSRVASGQLHGMAQRGGSVRSTVLADAGISPVIPLGGADLLLGFEPVETARAIPLLSPRTAVLLNTAPVVPFVVSRRAALGEENARYPDLEALLAAIRAAAPNVASLDATALAARAGSPRALNMVMLGLAAGGGALPIPPDELLAAACARMHPATREINARAFRAGMEAAP